MEEDTNSTSAGNWFKTTHWTVVLKAAGGEAAQAEIALADLCQTYWHPIYSFTRQSGQSPEDAQDLTQGFFARLLEKEFLKTADPQRGKFRSFLLMLLKRFLANEWDRANCQKRGGGRQFRSADEQDAEGKYLVELADDQTPEKIFERRWALTVLERAVERLQAEMNAAGKADTFLQIKHFLSGPGSGGSEIAARLQMSEGALRVAVHRLRRRYRNLVREQIAITVSGPEEIEDEIQHLFASLD